MSYNCYQEIPRGNTSKCLWSHDHLEETDEFGQQVIVIQKCPYDSIVWSLKYTCAYVCSIIYVYIYKVHIYIYIHMFNIEPNYI